MPVAVTCQRCSSTYMEFPSRLHRTKYCSRTCQNLIQSELAGLKSAADATSRRQIIRQPADHRLIPLTRGGVAWVDTCDFDLASTYNWALTDTGYARRTIKIDGVKKNERLHRVVLARKLARPLLNTEQADHVNGDRLDNRRANLRLATPQQNTTNARRLHKYYRGLRRSGKSRYGAKIKLGPNSFNIGTYDTAEEAAWMYDQWALALHGEFAVLNFDYVPL